jgi:hypothetical protein
MTTNDQQPESLFDLLALSLGNAALMGLGLVPDPDTQRSSCNLEVVEHNVELLDMLAKKTKGNLTFAEDKLLSSLLYDLRMKFVAAKKEMS